MRVTNKMLSYNFLKDMRNNLGNMKTLQQQLTSGKEIRRPSDNPFKVSRAMQLHTDIGANKQYNENIKDTINWLDTTDTALGQAGNVIQRVRELLLASGNAGYGTSERKAIKDEINQKIGEFSQILNTNFDGKYIFGGTRATSKPVDTEINADSNTELIYRLKDGGELTDKTSDEYKNITSKMQVEVSQGVFMEYNTTADEIIEFKNEKGKALDIMDVFKNIVAHLDGKAGPTDVPPPTTPEEASAKLVGSDLDDISDCLKNVLKLRAVAGAKENRMEAAKDRNVEENFNMTDILANTEDIDITEKTMEFATMQTVYVASLQTSAKIIQPSLMDYLR